MSSVNRRSIYCFILLILVLSPCSLASEVEKTPSSGTGSGSYTAIVNITYTDPATNQLRTEKGESGMYGLYSRMESEYGIVVHVRTEKNETNACTPIVNTPKRRWIALIQRGGCKFQQKIYNAAVKKNASAVVIYNDKDDDLLAMDHRGVTDVVAIFMKRTNGEHIARLVDNGTQVMMHISVGRHLPSSYSAAINKTSVLFVSISFIVLMIISLAWLVFYYIQRFRYAHAKERLSKRLMSAAKKAITKMPLRTIKAGDQETDSDFDQCAVCIENYKPSDVIRILPCKHVFHKSCVDPWLVEQRSCPMCKLDILKAYGLQVHGSHEMIAHMEYEGPSTSAGMSEGLGISSGVIEMGSVHGHHIVQYQPAQVEYHEAPSHAVLAGMVSSASSSSSNNDVPSSANTTTTAAVISTSLGNSAPKKTFSAPGMHKKVGAVPNVEPARCKISPAGSSDSLHSNDSDTNELQSLMPHVETIQASHSCPRHKVAPAMDSNSDSGGSSSEERS